MNKKVILYMPSCQIGGAEKTFIDLAKGLLLRGISVDILVSKLKGSGFKLDDSISVVILDRYRFIFGIPKLIKYLKNKKIILFAMTGSRLDALIIKKILGNKIKCVIRVDSNLTHQYSCGSIRTKLLLRTLGRCYHLADAIICVSDGAADDFKQAVPKAAHLVSTIYNPITSPATLEKSKQPLRYPWFNSGDNIPTAIFVGRLSRAKRCDLILKAFVEVLKTTKARLLIVGDGVERKNLEKLTNTLGIGDNVYFMGFQSNPYPYIAQSRVLVLASAFEGFPTVIVEAMFLGVPVVSSDCPSGPREILQDGKYGKLFAVGDHKAMAKLILETFNSPVNAQSLIDRAKIFSVDSSVENYLALFNSLE